MEQEDFSQPKAKWFRSKVSLLFASLLGGSMGLLSLTIEHTYNPVLLVILLPGIVGSMIATGNIHAFPVWIVSIINFITYFGLGWGIWHLLKSLIGRFRKI